MRQVIKIILLVFLVLSCENNKIHISIQIENSINDSINIYANGIEKIIIKNNDIFKSTLDIPSGYYNLKHGNQTTKIYLVKGMDLKIKINNEEFDKSISFIGDYYNENNLSGIHLFADNAWNSDFIKAYNINSIPRYLLIDIDGKIISANAPRPSDNDLLEKINSLKHINCDEKNCIV